MIWNIEITGFDLLLATGAGVLLLLLGIIGMRLYFKRLSNQDLKTRYKNKKWASPLEARTKYPAVDVFRWSNLFLKISLIAALSLTIGAFSWTMFEEKVEVQAFDYDLEVDLEIEPPRSAEPPPPPPPPPPPVIEEVPEDIEILEEDEIEFVDNSIDASTEVFAEPVIERKNTEEAAPPPPPPPPPPEPEYEEIFKVVEEMPRFPGCEDMTASMEDKRRCAEKKLIEFIYTNIDYPSVALDNNIEGTVVVKFVIDKDGTVTDAGVVRDIGAGCGEEAIRVINLMNTKGLRWAPGKQRGVPVKVMFALPVKFKLETL